MLSWGIHGTTSEPSLWEGVRVTFFRCEGMTPEGWRNWGQQVPPWGYHLLLQRTSHEHLRHAFEALSTAPHSLSTVPLFSFPTHPLSFPSPTHAAPWTRPLHLTHHSHICSSRPDSHVSPQGRLHTGGMHLLLPQSPTTFESAALIAQNPCLSWRAPRRKRCRLQLPVLSMAQGLPQNLH